MDRRTFVANLQNLNCAIFDKKLSNKMETDLGISTQIFRCDATELNFWTYNHSQMKLFNECASDQQKQSTFQYHFVYYKNIDLNNVV